MRWLPSERWSCRCGWAIATGEAELRGADYFGAVLNRVARVIAPGAQLLIDSEINWCVSYLIPESAERGTSMPEVLDNSGNVGAGVSTV